MMEKVTTTFLRAMQISGQDGDLREQMNGDARIEFARWESVRPGFSCLLAPFRGDLPLLPPAFLVQYSAVLAGQH
jgi:hypothetical protein